MTSTAFAPTDEMLSRLACAHARSPSDGGLIPMTKLGPMADPELHMAGHGLYGSADDYATFIRMWLNEGRGPGGEQILKPETVAMASLNHLPDGMSIKRALFGRTRILSRRQNGRSIKRLIAPMRRLSAAARRRRFCLHILKNLEFRLSPVIASRRT